MKCLELIIEDHAILRRGLDILDGMIETLEHGGRIEIAHVTAILNFLRLFGDEYHQAVEEKVFFPALLRAAPQDTALSQMLSEHREERMLVAEIEEALKSKSGVAFVRGSRRLSLLLRHHLDKEDTVIRRMAEQTLSNDEDNVVAAEFTRNHKQPETYVNFSRLEWKYTPKPAAFGMTH